MKTRPGKIYGPAGLFVMTVAFILLLLVGGIAIGFTRGKVRQVGLDIRKVEADSKTELERKSYYDETKSRVTDVLSLRDSADVKARLQPPSPDQIVLVRRRATFSRATERTVPEHPRFTALDIAFSRTTPSRVTALR